MKKTFLILAVLAAIFVFSEYAKAEEKIEEAENTEEETFPKVYKSGSTTVTITKDHVMTISGTGKMEYYYWNVNGLPWKDDREYVKKLVIQDGVTGLGMRVCSGMTNLEEVEFGSGIKSIPTDFFYGTTSLTSIELPSDLTFIGESAFSASGLTSVVIPDTVQTIDLYAFKTAPLESLVIPDNAAIKSQSFRGVTVKELTIGATQLQKYLQAYGGFASLDEVKIRCTSGDCKKVLREYYDWGYKFAAYADKVIYPSVKNADGSYTLFDNDGNIIGYKDKRIYTVEEANKVSKPTGNRVSIRYK